MLLFRRRQSRLEQPTLWLPDEMLIDLQQQAAEHSPEETGGMLLGWRNGTDILITTLVGPGPRAKQSRDQFTPDGAWQQHQLEAIYRESARTVTYLGDWHSHPHGSGRPSKRDRETAAAVAVTPDARAPQPLTLILAKRRRRWRAHPLIFRDGTLHPIRLNIHWSSPSEVEPCGVRRGE